MKKIQLAIKQLEEINWDFSDFSSSRYPFDLNSIPWYPATFISPIPRLLISSLSEEGDIVLDPFGGKGTTAIEATLQNRFSIYCDLNSFIAEITDGLFESIEYAQSKDTTFANEDTLLDKYIPQREQIPELLEKYNISKDIYRWFHEDTIVEILTIVMLIKNTEGKNASGHAKIRKLALSSILKFASSQQGHFTYITDNCAPDHEKGLNGCFVKKPLVYKNARLLYNEKITQIVKAANEFTTQFGLLHTNGDLPQILKKRKIVTGDSRNLSWIDDSSVDLVVTSPPYICSQDYIKTMRLYNMFFPNETTFNVDVKNEIGSRAKRRGKSAVVIQEFYDDMNRVFMEIRRVLKNGGVFALVVGQGKSKVSESYDVVNDLKKNLTTQLGFLLIFETTRRISKRVIQVGGVEQERIFIFRKGSCLNVASLDDKCVIDEL